MCKIDPRSGGAGILGNTLFNAKRKPILNSAADALKMLDAELALHGVLIEEWYFANPRAGSASCARCALCEPRQRMSGPFSTVQSSSTSAEEIDVGG